MKNFHILIIPLLLCSAALYGEEDYYDYQMDQGSCCQNGSERIYFYDRYQPVYYDRCCPYYHKQYGVSRTPHWPTKFYEPFHQQLMR